jgi:hypothetical protein
MTKVVEITPMRVAAVTWVKPFTGHTAPAGKMLSLPVVDGIQTYVGFNNESGDELYLFESETAACAYRDVVLEKYRQNPYYVTDEDGNTVVKDGQPIVAWVPNIEIKPISEADARETFSEWAAK